MSAGGCARCSKLRWDSGWRQHACDCRSCESESCGARAVRAGSARGGCIGGLKNLTPVHRIEIPDERLSVLRHHIEHAEGCGEFVVDDVARPPRTAFPRTRVGVTEICVARRGNRPARVATNFSCSTGDATFTLATSVNRPSVLCHQYCITLNPAVDATKFR